MGIFNKRNAALGWVAWQVGKRVANGKAKAAVPTFDAETKRPNKPAIVAGLATLGGLLMFWRKRSNGSSRFTPPE